MTKTTKTTKTTKLTVAKVMKAMEAYEQMADFRYNGVTYDNITLEDISITEVKARFREALGLPKDFRLTAKRMNDISDDLDGVTTSCSARGKQISVDLLADTLYTLKWPTAYAKSLSDPSVTTAYAKAIGGDMGLLTSR